MRTYRRTDSQLQHDPGKLEELLHSVSNYEWNVLGICEMRWKGIGEATVDGGHMTWWSGSTRKHERGVGFMINCKWTSLILECTPVNDRIINIRIAAKPRNVCIVQVYTQTSSASADDREEFYSALEDVLDSTEKRDYLIVQGDWNCQIGSDAYADKKGNVGKF